MSSGVTASTKWIELSDGELKTIQAFASQKLAENLGMSRRPTNAELEQWTLLHVGLFYLELGAEVEGLLEVRVYLKCQS